MFFICLFVCFPVTCHLVKAKNDKQQKQKQKAEGYKTSAELSS